MSLSEERIKEFQEIYKKEHGVELSYEEASEAAHNLAGLAEVLFDSWLEDQKRQKKLKEFPKGFQLDGVGYTCFICGSGTRAGENWYDKWGIKCTICQAGIDKGEVPAWAAKHKDGRYSKYDLETRFNLKTPALKVWIKDGVIKARTVMRESKRAHVQIFLLCDNTDFLPPKKLTESHTVKETKDGKDWYHLEPWYRFVDPWEHLKGYKIMDHMKATEPEEQKVES